MESTDVWNTYAADGELTGFVTQVLRYSCFNGTSNELEVIKLRMIVSIGGKASGPLGVSPSISTLCYVIGHS